MNNLYFWKNWNSPYKQLYFLLLFIFALTLTALTYASFNYMEGAVKWEVETELESVKVVIDQFARNLMNFTAESDSYYALDKYVSTQVQVNVVYSYIYLTVLILAVLFILTTFSFLDLYWYMGGMLLFLFFLFSMKIEMLQLFGSIGHIPAVAIFLLYTGVSYLYNSFYKSVSYLTRFLTFLVITIPIALVIAFYSSVATPFLYLANFGSLFPVWMTIIFVLVVGYDIIKALLYLVSSTSTVGSKNARLNFIFASLLYLANILLLLLKKTYLFELDIIYINPFVLLSTSAILGIWMFRKRTEMFSTVLPFAPAGAYVYLSLAIVSLAGAAYAILNGNIGIIESYERIIVYGHMFMGFIFLIYVLINFVDRFEHKISIYNIVYQPERLTFWAVPAFSITIAMCFFLYQRKYPYHLAMSGYYTYAGDVMTYEGQYPLSFEYYRTAVTYDYPNNRANYSIASLAAYLGEKDVAKGYYENALLRDPQLQSYIGLSNVYIETGELYKAIFNLQEGLTKFPGDARIYNNLGVLYYKANVPDSSAYYFMRAREIVSEKEVASSNILYLLARKNLYEDADSIIQTENYPDHISFQNNKLAILNQLGKRSSGTLNNNFLKDSVLNANVFAYLVNSNINSLKDTAQLVAAKIRKYKEIGSNELYKDQLTCQLALKKYYAGNRFEAIQDMLFLLSRSGSQSEYASILGYWMFEQEQNYAASEYFKKGSAGGNANAQINYTITSLLSDQKEDALFILAQLTNSPDKNIAGIANQLIKIASVKNSSDALVLDEPLRLQYFLISVDKNMPDQLDKLYSSFTNEQAKVYAACALARLYMKKNELAKARELFTSISAVQNLNAYADRERNYTHLLLSVEEKDAVFLLQNSKTLALNSDKEHLRNYFTAVGYECKGDSVQASAYYLKTLSSSPYMDLSLARAVKYLSNHGKDQETYNYMVEIVQNNPTVETRRIYLELCLNMSFLSFAESMLTDLKGQISATDYERYQQRLMKLQNQ